MDADDEAILRGDEPSDPDTSENAVTELPEKFQQWVKDNTTRVVTARSLPYFISDNSEYVADVIQSAYPSRVVSNLIAHQHFKDYIIDYRGRDEQFDKMLAQFVAGGMNDTERAILIRQMKQKCIGFTIADLQKSGVVNGDFIVAKTELNSVIVQGGTRWAKGKPIVVKELKMDMIVFKDKYGKEFAYPIGSAQVFSAVDASEAIHEFPPNLRKGIKRVSFMNRENPLDPYWLIKYDNPEHISMATDGGTTHFWKTPGSKSSFKEFMAHEAGHIIDGDSYEISSSAEWKEAIAKDNEFRAHLPHKGVSDYAEETNIHEDFAESMRRYINGHSVFKFAFPNRAAFIRKMAQKLSGHTPKH